MSMDPMTSLGSLFGASLARAHTGIAVGVYGLTCATPTQVALRGPLGQYPRVDDRQLELHPLGLGGPWKATATSAS